MADLYKTPESNLIDENLTGEVIYAGFWVRAWASLVDSIWATILILSLGWMVYGAAYFESEDFVQGGADFLISYILPFVITMAFWLYKAATPGKMLLGLKIVDADSFQPVHKQRLVIRYIAYYISLLPFALGFLWVAWDKRKQGWHDKIAGTVVIKVQNLSQTDS